MNAEHGAAHGRFPEATALRQLSAHPAYLAPYPALAFGIGILYALLLPGLLLGGLRWEYLRFLTPSQIAFAVGIGLLLPLVILADVFLWRHPRCAVPGGRPRAAVASSLLVSIVPNALCCTPIIPSLLALFVSGSTLVTISVPVQHALAVYEPELFIVSLLLLWLAIRLAARRLETSLLQAAALKSNPETKGPDGTNPGELSPRTL